nr:MAG TPA: Urotensin II [Caudoviricetes sp.]
MERFWIYCIRRICRTDIIDYININFILNE